MSGQEEDIAVRSAHVDRLIDKSVRSSAYATLALGYLLGVLAANVLTPINFLVFTTLEVLYCMILWSLLQGAYRREWQAVSGVVMLTILSIASGLLATTGLYFDWLVYLVTVALYYYFMPLRPAIFSTLLLFFATLMTLVFLDHGNWFNAFESGITLFPAFGFIAVFSLASRLNQVQRERAEKLLSQLEVSNTALEEAHAQLRIYANEVEELTIVRERTRLAREIHDTLGHYLTILSIQLETISKLQERDPARAALEVTDARRVASQSMQEVRNAVAALRPTSIATLNLVESLTQLGGEFEHHAGETELTLDLDTQLPALSPDLHVALYRAAQEALTNVRKHAHAANVLLRLRYENEQLELVVLDNGNGPTAESGTVLADGGFGLIGLRERIELLGGHAAYSPAQPRGYRVTVQVHVPSPVSLAPMTVRGE